MDDQIDIRRPFGRSALAWAEDWLARLFIPCRDRVSRGVEWLGLAALFLFGINLLGGYYSWGNISLDFADWAEVFGPRFAILQNAAQTGQFPWHAGDTTALRGVTDRYLASPDAPFSPQFLLLRFVELPQFMFYNTILLYTASFAGLLLFYKKYRLSLFAFAVMFFLFNFNGHIIAHMSVGHMNWLGFFLQPFFLFLLFGLIEKQKAGWGWYLGLTLTLLAILLQGHFHLFIWCLLFLVFLAILNWRLIKPVLIGGVLAVLVSLARLLPPVLVVNEVTQEPLGGFASWTELVASMVVLRDPDNAAQIIKSFTFQTSWWELDHFIGLIGLLLLVVFGILIPLHADRSKNSRTVQVLVPSLIFAALSVGYLYTTLVNLPPFPIPPFNGERVTARFLALPMLAVLTLAIITLDGWLKSRRLASWHYLLLLTAAGMLMYDLYTHMQAWRIRYLDGLVNLFPKMPFDPARHTVSNHPDAIYTNLVFVGGAIGLATLIFLVIQAVRARKAA